MGKTRLHEAALDRARGWEMRVRRAAGAELERNIAFGVAAQLLGTAPGELPLGRRDAAPAPEDLSRSHELFTLLATAEDRVGGTLIAVDDLHWCDAASLDFLLYLLHRLDEVPVALVMTRRPGMGDEISAVLDRIAADPHVRVERLPPLGHDSVRELARRALGACVNTTVVDACKQATAGNPFYLHELLLALSEEDPHDSEELTSRARALAPDAVTRTLRVRVGRLGRPAAALARAVAILGDDVPLRHASALSGLPLDAASSAADALAAVEVLLAREPLRFVHPLVRHAVEYDIPASQRATLHLEAARLLCRDGADHEQVAAHLLRGRAQSEEWVVEQLRAAAREASLRGAPQSAVEYLKRALEEPPAGELRTQVLAELGVAEAAAGLRDAATHLYQAAAATTDPVLRLRLLLRRAQALSSQGLHRMAVDAYDAALRELPAAGADPGIEELEVTLRSGLVSSTLMVPDRHETLDEVWTGASAKKVAEMAERAWDEGRLLDRESANGMTWVFAAAALTWSGELERAVAVADAALEDARRRMAPLGFATASYVRAVPCLAQGRVRDALADLELARDARRYGWRTLTRAAAARYCLALIETGALERAEEALSEDEPLDELCDLEDLHRLAARAELRLAQGRPQESLTDALAAGRALGQSIRAVEIFPWRAIAAQAALALGDRSRARDLALEECAIAERTGVVHTRIRAYRVFGLTEDRARAVAALRTAVELGRAAPQRLETMRALVDLGAALRRANQRAASRRPLQQAADMTLHAGATVLHERARTELAASGARPRREALLSGPASLTPSERRIAEHAASGRSNREIAQALFVTPKTVEYHLRNAYRKLGIERRNELPEALADEPVRSRG